jgi:hypothetical protein
MSQEPKSPKPLIFRKIKPRYNKALIPFLIVSFIVAVMLLLVFYKYFFKPVFEKKGALDLTRKALVVKFEKRLKFKV